MEKSEKWAPPGAAVVARAAQKGGVRKVCKNMIFLTFFEFLPFFAIQTMWFHCNGFIAVRNFTHHLLLRSGPGQKKSQ